MNEISPLVAAHSQSATRIRIWAVLALVVMIGVLIFIPCRIGSFGFMPPDDANRHVGKAVSGKQWNEILVMRPEITTDMHHGWDAMLGYLHRHAGLGPNALIAFSVAFCFLAFAGLPVFFLRRGEAWVAALGVVLLFDPFGLGRIFLGRPFIISCTVQALLLLKWERFAAKKTDYFSLFFFTASMTAVSWLAPTSAYLFAIPLLGFALARQWRALIRIAACMVAGCAAGYALTGYPLQLAKNTLYMLTAAPDQHLLSRMLVSEFVPQSGNLLFAFLIVLLIALRIFRKKWERSMVDNPVFYNVLCGTLLGFFVGRFWADWGMVAAFAWIAREFHRLSEDYLPFNSIKRFGAVCILSVCFFIVVTADIQSRWTYCVPRYPLQYDKATSEEKTWFPDSGGIFYNNSMMLFYQTFFYNPHAPWRYMVGFEPVLMTKEDLASYRNIQRSDGSVDSYEPWIKKMTNRDRMVMCSDFKPRIESLEWKCLNRNQWLGRLPVAGIKDSLASKKNCKN